MIEPFNNKDNLDSNNLIYNSIHKKNTTYWKMLILLIVLIIIMIVLGIIIIIISLSDFEDNKIVIECEYEIDEPKVTKLLSNEFNISNIIFSIYIGKKNNDGEPKLKQINKNNTYYFSEAGTYEINFVFKTQMNIAKMFKDIDSLVKVNISSDKGIYNYSLYQAFSGCKNLIDFYSNINGTNNIDMSYMFYNCTKLSKVEFINSINMPNNLEHMFDNCNNLTTLTLNNGLNTSNVTNMSYMFSDCHSINSLNLSFFNISKVNDTSYMFANCTSLNNSTLLFPEINVSKVKIDEMFKGWKNESLPEWYKEFNNSI